MPEAFIWARQGGKRSALAALNSLNNSVLRPAGAHSNQRGEAMGIVRIVAALVILGGTALFGLSACDAGAPCIQGHYDYWTTTHTYYTGSGKYRTSHSYTTLEPYWVCDVYGKESPSR